MAIHSGIFKEIWCRERYTDNISCAETRMNEVERQMKVKTDRAGPRFVGVNSRNGGCWMNSLPIVNMC